MYVTVRLLRIIIRIKQILHVARTTALQLPPANGSWRQGIMIGAQYYLLHREAASQHAAGESLPINALLPLTVGPWTVLLLSVDTTVSKQLPLQNIHKPCKHCSCRQSGHCIVAPSLVFSTPGVLTTPLRALFRRDGSAMCGFCMATGMGLWSRPSRRNGVTFLGLRTFSSRAMTVRL